MDRRAFMKAFSTFAAGAALSNRFLPARNGPNIDLRYFCDPNITKFDLGLPFSINDTIYASDARIAVAVSESITSIADRKGKFPNMEFLPWNSGDVWRPWPKKSYFLSPNQDCQNFCIECNGSGFHGIQNVDYFECKKCFGVGSFGNDWEDFTCDECAGRCYFGTKCAFCEGGYTKKPTPGVQLIGNTPIDAYYDSLVRKLDCVEFSQSQLVGVYDEPKPIVAFRFNGGSGLLMGLNLNREKKLAAW